MKERKKRERLTSKSEEVEEKRRSERMSQKFITPASMETTRASQVEFTGVCASVFVRMRACSCVCVCVSCSLM